MERALQRAFVARFLRQDPTCILQSSRKDMTRMEALSDTNSDFVRNDNSTFNPSTKLFQVRSPYHDLDRFSPYKTVSMVCG